MPDALKLPWMWRPIVPLVSARDSIVNKLVANRFPGFSSVVRALDHLAEPAAALRSIQAVRIHGRSFKMKELPAGKVRSGDFPFVAFTVCGKDESTLPRAYQQS